MDDDTYIWTATLANGTFGFEATPSCTNWTSTDGEVGTIGNAGATDSTWTNAGVDGCYDIHTLYCVELNGDNK